MNNQENQIVPGQNSFLSGMEKLYSTKPQQEFGSFTAVDISFEVYKGEILVFLGQMEWKNNCHENAHRDLHAYFGSCCSWI
jgi:hypothetical protein